MSKCPVLDKVASMLNVKMGEEFSVPACGCTARFRFTERGLEAKHLREHVEGWVVLESPLNSLLIGTFGVKKLPFQPIYGETFFTYDGDKNNFQVVEAVWAGTLYDRLLLDKGMVFTTRNEADLRLGEFFDLIWRTTAKKQSVF